MKAFKSALTKNLQKMKYPYRQESIDKMFPWINEQMEERTDQEVTITMVEYESLLLDRDKLYSSFCYKIKRLL